MSKKLPRNKEFILSIHLDTRCSRKMREEPCSCLSSLGNLYALNKNVFGILFSRYNSKRMCICPKIQTCIPLIPGNLIENDSKLMESLLFARVGPAPYLNNYFNNNNLREHKKRCSSKLYKTTRARAPATLIVTLLKRKLMRDSLPLSSQTPHSSIDRPHRSRMPKSKNLICLHAHCT